MKTWQVLLVVGAGCILAGSGVMGIGTAISKSVDTITEAPDDTRPPPVAVSNFPLIPYQAPPLMYLGSSAVPTRHL